MATILEEVMLKKQAYHDRVRIIRRTLVHG